MNTDCLIIGFNDYNFENQVEMVRGMGTDSGAYRDLNLAFIEYCGKPYRALDILSHFYFEDKSRQGNTYHNADTLWPTILYLGSYLAKRGLSFDYINLFHFEKEKLKEKLHNDKILTAAITTTLYVIPQPIIEIVSFIKTYNPKVKTIVGGPFICNQTSSLDRLSLKNLLHCIGADIYVDSNEGESALVQIIEALKNESDLGLIDNIFYRKGDDYLFTTKSQESNPLESNPVDYSLFPEEDIGEFVSLRTAKSCPFSCAYCGFPIRAGKYTYTTVEHIEKELNAIKDIGTVTTITFLDDTFNVPLKRFKEILRMMIRNKYGFKWNSYYRCDHWDEETFDLMQEAGCEGAFLGVESGSDLMLSRMHKSARRKDYLKVIPLLRQAGIITHANLIIGFPGETEETFEETFSLIEDARPDFFRAQLWYADPVTPVWKHKEEYGINGQGFNWSHKTMDYHRACDMIDKMFLSLENSTWLPQWGFELWSVFYLQRKGMTRAQVMQFVKSFNAAVREKLLFPLKKEMNPKLLECLKQSARFDSLCQRDMSIVENVFSASYYNVAEKFWIQEFDTKAFASNIRVLYENLSHQEQGKGIVACRVESRSIEKLCMDCKADVSHVILAAYSILLSLVSGLEETVIVTSIDDKSLSLPIRFSPLWDLSFRIFVSNVCQKLHQAMTHKLFAFHFIDRTLKSQKARQDCSEFDVAYLYHTMKADIENGFLNTESRSYPEFVQGIKLSLGVFQKDSSIHIEFRYEKNWFNIEAIEAISAYLSDIFQRASENADIRIGEILPGQKKETHHEPGEANHEMVFNF